MKFRNKNPDYGYREQIAGCQRQGQGVGKIGEGGQKVQSSNYKISPGDVMYSMVTLVNNNVLYI